MRAESEYQESELELCWIWLIYNCSACLALRDSFAVMQKPTICATSITFNPIIMCSMSQTAGTHENINETLFKA